MEIYFLVVTEAGSLRSGNEYVPVLLKALFMVYWWHISCSVLTWGGVGRERYGERELWCPFWKGYQPHSAGPIQRTPSNFNYYLKAPFPISIMWVLQHHVSITEAAITFSFIINGYDLDQENLEHRILEQGRELSLSCPVMLKLYSVNFQEFKGAHIHSAFLER